MSDRPYQPRQGGRFEADPDTGKTRRVPPDDKGRSAKADDPQGAKATRRPKQPADRTPPGGKTKRGRGT